MQKFTTAGFIRTYSGRKFWPMRPDARDVCMDDIAHALSLNCRWGGHCCYHYPVAAHSLHVSYMAEDAFQGLMHDASEAYLVDLPKPIKERIDIYKQIEYNVMLVIAMKFGFHWPESPNTKQADEAALSMERDALFTAHNWHDVRRVRAPREVKWKHEERSTRHWKQCFLERAYELRPDLF